MLIIQFKILKNVKIITRSSGNEGVLINSNARTLLYTSAVTPGGSPIYILTQMTSSSPESWRYSDQFCHRYRAYRRGGNFESSDLLSSLHRVGRGRPGYTHPMWFCLVFRTPLILKTGSWHTTDRPDISSTSLRNHQPGAESEPGTRPDQSPLLR